MKCSILAVEDSATQAQALITYLQDEYAITLARSGEEALERLADAEFDLVLSDIMMPGIDGYELCRRIKDDPDWRRTPVVLLTSLSDPMDIVRGLAAGADNYITKPYEPEHLAARIGHVFGQKRLRRTSESSTGVVVEFMGTKLTITSDREQILDLLLSSIEDVIRTNQALEASRRELALAHAQLKEFAREKAREAEISTERYRTLMQNAGDAILVLDRNAVIVEANARAADLFGRPEAALHAHPLEHFVPAEEADEFRAMVRQSTASGRAEGREGTMLRADGTAVACEVTISGTTVNGEELLLAIVRDVTEKRLATEQLRRRERQLAEAQEIASVGSWERDLSTSELTWSEQVYKITGFEPGTDIYFPAYCRRIHPEDLDFVQASVQRAIESRGSFSVDYRIAAQGNSYRVVHTIGSVEVDADGVPRRMSGTIQDITERKEAEEALQRSQEELRQAQKMEAIGRLAGGIAHDFNNILTAIKGNVQMALLEVEDVEPLRTDLVEIDKASDRASALTRQLLTFSRKQVIAPRVLELDPIVADAEKMLRRLLREDIEFETRLASRPARIRVDVGQIDQVLLNLTVNSRDAMPHGGRLTVETGTVHIAAGVDAPADLRPGCYVLLTVTDTGEGMTAEVQERALEPFFSTRPPGRGTGLGLSTVYGIVKQTGGGLAIESEPGSGTTVRIYLPCAEGATEAAPQTADLVRYARRRATIMLVEDEAPVRDVVRRVLERSGHEVATAADGDDALRILARRSEPMDLLITDVVLPGISGRDLSLEVRSRYPGIRVLFMSGYTDEVISHHGVLDAGVEFINKPFSPRELVEKVNEVLGARPQDLR